MNEEGSGRRAEGELEEVKYLHTLILQNVGLLMARNAVAGHYGNLIGHMTLPEMLKDSHVCKYCPYLPQCCLVHK